MSGHELGTGELVPPHDACPGSWCITIVCADCGEMLTNPKPYGDVLKGACMTHGRGSVGVLMRREDCLLDPLTERVRAVVSAFDGWMEGDHDIDRVMLAIAEARRPPTALIGRRPCHPDASYSGIDQTDLRDPNKVWRCDSCGEEGTSAALDATHIGSRAEP